MPIAHLLYNVSTKHTQARLGTGAITAQLAVSSSLPKQQPTNAIKRICNQTILLVYKNGWMRHVSKQTKDMPEQMFTLLGQATPFSNPFTPTEPPVC